MERFNFPARTGGLRRDERYSAIREEVRVDLRVVLPLVGQLILGEAGIDGAGLDAGVAVDACFAEDQLPDEWQNYTKINADFFANR